MGVVLLADQQRPKRRWQSRSSAARDGGRRPVPHSSARPISSRCSIIPMSRVYEAAIAQTPAGPLPYYAMELIDGTPIDAYVQANALVRDDRVRLIIKLCQAVQHAHSKGVIHRDLKPANILVTKDDGEPRSCPVRHRAGAPL